MATEAPTVAFTSALTHDPVLYSVPCVLWALLATCLASAADNVKAVSMFTPKSVPIERAPRGVK